MLDEAQALERYESAVLKVLRLQPEKELPRLSRVYDHLSQQMTVAAESADLGPTALLAQDRLDARDLDAVWGLIYGARSYAIARRLFAEHPPPEGLFVEVGAGWGPFGLAAAELGREVALVDVSRARLDRAAELFVALGLRAPAIIAADAWRAPLPAGTRSIAAAYSFGEMIRALRNPIQEAATQLRNWLGRANRDGGEGGRIYVVEPGTQSASRRLQAVRDAVVESVPVGAPCTGSPRCPMLADDRDWCHFTWRLPAGPVARELANQAERRWQEVHFSYLVLGTLPEAGVDRVLEVRGFCEPKVRARLCTSDGLIALTALRRHAAASSAIAELGPGSRVRIAREELIEKGDGLRLERETSLVALPSAFHVEHPL